MDAILPAVYRLAGSLLALMVTASPTVSAHTSSHHTHIRVEPNVNFALPPKAAGCGGATALAGGAERIPITVSTVAGQVEETVNVCIDGQGPFPFVIDTGAAGSFIDTRLAAQLDLADEGSSVSFDGVGCTGTGQVVAVASWSVGGVILAPQSLVATEQPGVGAARQPVGLLGSDVLSRFGAVRLDFKAQTLTFEGPQGPVIAAVDGEVHGPTGPLPPAALTHGQSGTTVPLTVVLTPGDISLNVSVRFGKGPAQDFVVDTGATASVVADSVVPGAHLAHSDLAQRQDSVCSIITVPLVHSGHWSIPGLALHPQLLGAANFGPASAGGIVGAVGSDQLQRFGWVIFDYSGGRLVLG